MTAWSARPLGEMLLRAPRYGINAAGVPQRGLLPTYLRITDIDDEGRFRPDPAVAVDDPRSPEYVMGLGQIVFARTGASVGKSYLYNPQDGELVYAGFLINVAPDPALLSPSFLAHLVRTKRFRDWVSQTSARSGQPGINSREYSRFELPVPPPEVQRVIAEALDDADALIAGLERMIAKKEAIKQGMMQQLLTGRTRLPGFTAPWQTRRLGDLGVCLRGVAYDPAQDLSQSDTVSTVRLLRSNNVQGGRIVLDDLQFVHKRRVSDVQVLRPGDALLCMANGSKRLVGKSAPFTSHGPQRYTFGAFMGVFRPSTGVCDPDFAGLLLRSHEFRKYVDLTLAGSSINNLGPRDVMSFAVAIPLPSEQRPIARVLGQATAELEGLHSRMTKAQLVKGGMMQQLLTGRVRLPVGDAA